MRLVRDLELTPSGLHTAITATNATGAPVAAALQARMEFSPEDIDSASMSFTRVSGEHVTRKFIVDGEPPTGKDTWIGAERPSRSWTLQGSRPLLTQFPDTQVERSYVNWTAKSRPGVTFGIWSPERLLQPGQSLVLEVDYAH